MTTFNPSVETFLTATAVPAQVLRDDLHALDTAQAFAAYAAEEAAVRDRERRLPQAELERFSALGLGSISIPKAYGGPGVSHRTVAQVFKTISAADPALGQIPQNHFGIIRVVELVGTSAQKHGLFKSVLEGNRIGNAGPERGTRHTLELKARAKRVGGNYVISGEKFYSTGALFARWVSVKALDDQGEQVMAFVPQDAPGLRIIDDWSGFGQRTTASGTVLLDEVTVPAAHVVRNGELSRRPSTQGAYSQLIQAAIDAGIAQGALADTQAFVRERARPWPDAKVEAARLEPYVIAEVGRLQVAWQAADALLERAALILDEVAAGLVSAEAAARASIAVAEAKVLTTEIALRASEKLFELAGSRATLAEHNLDRHWRNARVHTLHDPVRWKAHAVGHYHLNGAHPARHSWI